MYKLAASGFQDSKLLVIFGFQGSLSIETFFCLGTQPSQFIKVLNSGILHPYQHVKHKINLTIRPGITLAFLKFLHRVDTDSWRHLLHQLVRFSHAFPLDSFSRTARTRSTFSADNYRRWEKTKTSDIHKLCKSIS